MTVTSIRKLNYLSTCLLKGHIKAGSKLKEYGVIWQISRSEPKNWKLISTPENHLFYQQLNELNLSDLQRAIVYNTQIHFGVNSEHIAPLPVLVTISKYLEYILIQARDLGPGLGSYLENIGFSFSTRPWERQLQFGLEDQGNGLLFALNQTLNGCRGKAIIESCWQRITLEKIENKILGRRTFSHLSGTRFLLFLPLTQPWTQEPSGWDPYEHIYLEIFWKK